MSTTLTAAPFAVLRDFAARLPERRAVRKLGWTSVPRTVAEDEAFWRHHHANMAVLDFQVLAADFPGASAEAQTLLADAADAIECRFENDVRATYSFIAQHINTIEQIAGQMVHYYGPDAVAPADDPRTIEVRAAISRLKQARREHLAR